MDWFTLVLLALTVAGGALMVYAILLVGTSGAKGPQGPQGIQGRSINDD
jgi:hypothetical protein